MKKHIEKYCRESISLANTVCSDSFPPFLGLFTLISLLPAFLYGCNVPQALPSAQRGAVTKVMATSSQGQINELDIFVFNDDKMQRLDSYQKVTDPLSWNHELISGSGDRIITVCANSSKCVEDWFSISSMSSLEEMTASLEEEDRRSPKMNGSAWISDLHDNGHASITLSPIFSIVKVNSIRCDFSRRPYAGERLEDVKVYLTNVNAECRILDKEDILPIRIINAGRLHEEDLRMFPDPSILTDQINENIGPAAVYPGIEFICYPNNSTAEGPGTPFTRLVIEGKVQGETFYWPLNINRDDGGYGVGRNERYVYDITINRKGTKDPDIPVRTEDMDISFKIEKWNEKEEYAVIF